MITQIVEFFNHPVFIVFGGLSALLILLGVLYQIICWFLGVTPIIARLGKAIWKRDVSIVGNKESFEFLRDTLLSSELFRKKNITFIDTKTLEKVKKSSLILVDWETSEDKIDTIFVNRKDESVPVIIYVGANKISGEKIAELGNRINTIVVNFRGRLVNDVLISMMTS